MAIRLDLNKINEEKEEYIKYLHDFHNIPPVGEKFRYVIYYENDPSIQKARSEAANFRKQEREAMLAIKKPPQKPAKKKKTKQENLPKSVYALSARNMSRKNVNVPSMGKYVGRINNISEKIISIRTIEDLNAIFSRLEMMEPSELDCALKLCKQIVDPELASDLIRKIKQLLINKEREIWANTMNAKCRMISPDNPLPKAVLISVPMGGKPRR